MIKISQAIIVEGRYDKIKLSQIVDAPIIETNGFRVFSDRQKQLLIRRLAKTRGIIIMTDSDSAGFMIRNFLRGVADKSRIIHCYIPQIEGKEKRKPSKSKEGFLGVEGVSDEVILNALRKCGATVEVGSAQNRREITKKDMYLLGLTGSKNSSQYRRILAKELELPPYLSTNAMLTALNCFYSFEELKELTEKLFP